MLFYFILNIFIYFYYSISGHDEYHVAHSFFFGGGCVYLLLFNCSYDQNSEIIEKNKLVYWLHFLQTQVGNSASFILIGTKLDILENQHKRNKQKRISQINECKKKKIIYQKKKKNLNTQKKLKLGLKSMFLENNITISVHKFVNTSTKEESLFFPLDNFGKQDNMSGVGYIKNLLITQYDNVKCSVSTSLNHKYVFDKILKLKTEEKIGEKLQLKKSFLDLSVLQKELKEENISLQSLKSILIDLNKLGVISYFDNEFLGEIVITDPRW